jgi:hypothetical protein
MTKAAAPLSKYHAVRTAVDGVVFDSKREARRWAELQLLERAGHISALRRQVVFNLHAPISDAAGAVTGVGIIATYIADFEYYEKGQRVVEDAKGVRTPIYRLKCRHLLVEYGIQIRET